MCKGYVSTLPPFVSPRWEGGPGEKYVPATRQSSVVNPQRTIWRNISHNNQINMISILFGPPPGPVQCNEHWASKNPKWWGKLPQTKICGSSIHVFCNHLYLGFVLRPTLCGFVACCSPAVGSGRGGAGRGAELDNSIFVAHCVIPPELWGRRPDNGGKINTTMSNTTSILRQ